MTNAPAHLEAVQLRQADIQYHDIRQIRTNTVERLEAISCPDDIVPFASQRVRHHIQKVCVIIDDECFHYRPLDLPTVNLATSQSTAASAPSLRRVAFVFRIRLLSVSVLQPCC
jgi:hypothetical protein